MKKIPVILSMLLAVGVNAQVLISGGNYSQNFDSLPSTGTSGTWTDNVTPLVGWYASRALPAPAGQAYTVFRVDAGANSSGTIFDYGTASATDRALGSVASGTPGTNAIGLRIQNDTGATWSGDIQIGYTGEQWRNGGNATAQIILAFGYAISSTPFTGILSAHPGDPAFTPVAALNFTSPTVGAVAAALDGNNAANRVALSGSILSVTLNAGDEIMLRWLDPNDPGNDHGGGIDDLTVNFIAVPEPATAVLMGLGALALVMRRRNK